MKGPVKIILAVLIGLITTLIVISYIQTKEAEFMGLGPQAEVYVAVRDIEEGEVFTEKMVRKIRIPDKPGIKQPGAFEAPRDQEKLLGKYSIVPIKANEQVIQTKVAETPNQSLAMVLRNWPGTRTVTLTLGGAERAVAGMIRPGDHVDIIGLFNYNIGGEKVREIRYFLQNVEILAMDQQLGYGPKKGRAEQSEGRPSYSTITLAVPPEEVLRLTLANKLGTFYYTLRPADDETTKAYPALDAEKVLGNPAPVWQEADERQRFLPPDFLKNLSRVPRQ